MIKRSIAGCVLAAAAIGHALAQSQPPSGAWAFGFVPTPSQWHAAWASKQDYGAAITTPVITGGNSAGSTLTLRSTSGAGTSDAIIFQTGSQNEAARFDTAGRLIIGTADIDPRLSTVESLEIRAELDSTSLSGQFAHRIFAVINGAGSAASYEKAGLNVVMETLDPSVYGGSPILRDAVAIAGGATIQSPNMTGRAWAGLFEAVVNPSADGAATGIEVSVTNDSTDQPSLNSTLSKIVLSAIAYDGPATAGLYFKGAVGGTFHRMVVSDPSYLAAGGTFLELLNVLAVYGDGWFWTIGGYATSEGAVTLSNGLNSNISIVGGFATIAGPSAGFSVGGFLQVIGDGDHLTIYNSTNQQMTIVNEDASTGATSRVKTLTGGNVALRAGTSAANFVYSATAQRWILTGTN